MGIDEHVSSRERAAWGMNEDLSAHTWKLGAQLGFGEGAFWVAILESRWRADCCPIGYGRPSFSAFRSSQPSEPRMECQSGESLDLAGVLARHGGRTRLVW